MRRRAWLAAALCLGALGCGPTVTDIDMTEYDRYCVDDEACILAVAGDVCACSCESSAINRKAVDAYRADYQAGRDACEDTSECAPCETVYEAFCNDDGVCDAREVTLD